MGGSTPPPPLLSGRAHVHDPPKGSGDLATTEGPKRRQSPLQLSLISRIVDGSKNWQGEEPDEVLALLRREAIDGEQDFVDGLADRHEVADQKHPWQRLSGTH